MRWLLVLTFLNAAALLAGSTDLAIALSGESDVVSSGQSIWITVTVDNLSATTAEAVEITCDIPPGFTIADITDDGAFNDSERIITWPSFSLLGSSQVQRAFLATGNLPDNGMPLFFMATDTNAQSQHIYSISNNTPRQETEALPGLFDPTGIQQDSFGNLFVLDAGNPDLFDGSNQPINDGQIRRLDPAGTLSIVASGELLTNPRRFVFLPDGNMIVADPDGARTDVLGNPSDDQNGRLILIDPGSGIQSLFFEGAPLVNPMDLVLDGDGDLWVVDLSGKVIRFTYPDATPAVQIEGDPALLPASIDFHPDHGLIFGDAISGLVKVNPSDSDFEIITPIGGSPFELIDPRDVAFSLGGRFWALSAGNNPDPLFIEFAPDTGEGIREISSGPGLQYTDPKSLFGSAFFHTNAGVNTETVDIDNSNNGASLYTRLEFSPNPSTVVVNVQESIVVTDQVTADPALQVVVSEQITTTDTVSAAPALLVAVQESVSISDQPSANPALQINVSETIATFDQLNPTIQSGGPMLVRSFIPQDQIPLSEAQIRFTPTQIYLQFSELMNDPDGDAEENDVTNPIHYTLVRSEGDPGLSDCGVPGTEDELVDIDHIIFYNTIKNATLNFPEGLAIGHYRLLVCGDSGLQDLEGIAFDGDGNNQPGGNYVVDFEVTATNAFFNPHFDFQPSLWQPVNETAELIYSTEDANNLAGSGSVGIQATYPETEHVFHQCISVSPNTWYKLVTKSRNSIESGSPFPMLIRVEWFTEALCNGEALEPFQTTEIFTNTFGEWLPFSQMIQSPEGAVSAQVIFGFQAGASPDQLLLFDDMQFVQDPATIFSDGFESGDLGNWQRQ